MKPANRTWSVFESSICHYCGDKATTTDHVVPRTLLPKPMSRVPYWFRANNEVPACSPCNRDKAHFRSDCRCDVCEFVWGAAAALYLSKEFVRNLEIRYIVRSPG